MNFNILVFIYIYIVEIIIYNFNILHNYFDDSTKLISDLLN